MKIKIVAFIFLLIMGGSMALAEELPGDSIYQIDSKWVDQDGKEFELKDLRGKPTILSMVYLTCKYICPAVISEVQALESELSKKVKNSFQIVLVSFDPERDTPMSMKKYATEERKLDLSRWRLVTNKNESKIRELAVATNFKYMKDENGEFTHSYMILLLDQNGVVQSRLDGANLDHKPMIQKLKELSKK
ncbi:MAG: SCO family protein [Bdellovibrionota bacterium]